MIRALNCVNCAAMVPAVHRPFTSLQEREPNLLQRLSFGALMTITGTGVHRRVGCHVRQNRTCWGVAKAYGVVLQKRLLCAGSWLMAASRCSKFTCSITLSARTVGEVHIAYCCGGE